MAQVTMYFDPVGNTLNLWWGNKSEAQESIEVKNPHRDDVILVDKRGKPIGLEIIGFFPEELDPVSYLTKKQLKTLLKTGSINLSKPRKLTKLTG